MLVQVCQVRFLYEPLRYGADDLNRQLAIFFANWIDNLQALNEVRARFKLMVEVAFAKKLADSSDDFVISWMPFVRPPPLNDNFPARRLAVVRSPSSNEIRVAESIGSRSKR